MDNDDSEDSDRLVWSIKKRNKFLNIAALKSSPCNRSELDSHADTCVGGSNCVLLEDSGEVATVFSFSEESKPFDKIPIGTIATAWTFRSGTTYLCILEAKQFLLDGFQLA